MPVFEATGINIAVFKLERTFDGFTLICRTCICAAILESQRGLLFTCITEKSYQHTDHAQDPLRALYFLLCNEQVIITQQKV